MQIRTSALLAAILLGCSLSVVAQTNPKVTLDEFFNSVSFTSVELSPDGASVVIATERADWDQQIFRSDLWLYRDDAKGGSLIPLTQSGHDSEPKWSPDGKWIAFLSERKTGAGKSDDSDSDSSSKDETSQLYVISPNGGEAIPQTDIPRYHQLFRNGRIQLKNLITDHYPLARINEAIDGVRSGAIAGRCLIMMDPLPSKS